ncbi:hypothetical protein [Brasilonema octagenarum]|uniref:CBS domain-containing protein n=1 Tax=Brasilonema octagenarum UFV-OR1 TaxID=417115 RepID=A0ABX1MFE7_9CYAN|nr:hypothetical protein [Brasilonema octagenarum]NMF66133.1 hypothetical protein [Brasilonema octagenarum UFV-OR1]
MSLTQDHMIKDFQLLAGTLSPAEALVELVTEYGVVLDEHSKPVALVTADDLEQAANQGISSLLDTKIGFPATIIVGCQVMQDLVKWEGFIDRYERIRGVIIIDDNGVFGILAITTVRNYLNTLKNRDYELRGDRSGAAGDSGLPGRHQSSKMVLKCGECGFVNELSYIDYKKLHNCKNPNKLHELKLT